MIVQEDLLPKHHAMLVSFFSQNTYKYRLITDNLNTKTYSSTGPVKVERPLCQIFNALRRVHERFLQWISAPPKWQLHCCAEVCGPTACVFFSWASLGVMSQQHSGDNRKIVLISRTHRGRRRGTNTHQHSWAINLLGAIFSWSSVSRISQ